MSKTNESSKLGRAPQVRELRENELGGVSGGYVYDATYVVGVVAAQTDGAFRGRYQLRVDEPNSLLSTRH